MFRKFEKTIPSWFIVLLPTISVVLVIVDKVVNLELDKGKGYVAIILLISILVDFAAILFIGAILNLCDEYGDRN